MGTCEVLSAKATVLGLLEKLSELRVGLLAPLYNLCKTPLLRQRTK